MGFAILNLGNLDTYLASIKEALHCIPGKKNKPTMDPPTQPKTRD
jgi:hypothetical protein